MADGEAPKPALKVSGHCMAERLVGSLFHCLSVAGKQSGKRLDGLLSHDANEFGVYEHIEKHIYKIKHIMSLVESSKATCFIYNFQPCYAVICMSDCCKC